MFSTLISFSRRRRPTFAQKWVQQKKLKKNQSLFTPYQTIIHYCKSIDQLDHMKELIDQKIALLQKKKYK